MKIKCKVCGSEFEINEKTKECPYCGHILSSTRGSETSDW